MEALYNWLNSLVNKNKSDFAKWPGINWLNQYSAVAHQTRRDDLLKSIGNSVLFRDTKPFYNRVSKGCSICGSGKWSCLFITNKCNAGCFYCPAPQLHDEVPSTQGLEFDKPAGFAEYVKYFDFKGVSFSGGEPLLYFDRTLAYLQQVRAKCDSDLYTWMYTNGILADKEKLNKLASAGLNEIRFDIGATAYNLNKLKLAKGIIPNVTIEIPAVPEEKNKLISLLPDMVKAGVTNLNLHQLRLTSNNANNLLKRGYTIINAERTIVLESELSALEIINYAQENNIDIGINYCSFHFKNRFQKSGFRNIITKTLFPEATITQNGYIREYSGDSILYKTIRLTNNRNDMPNLNELALNGNKYFYSAETVLKETNLPVNYREKIQQLFTREPKKIPEDPLLFKIWQLEYIENGLRSY